jgi:hypothetical protein
MRKFTSALGHEIGLHDVNEREATVHDATTGYFLRPDGSEGGGLWFDRGTLTDHDGTFSLSPAVTQALRDEGFAVGWEFE